MNAVHIGDTTVGQATPTNLPELRYGKKRFPNLGGFLIKTLSRNILLIRGGNDDATAHGIVGFLRRYVGVRQFWPGGWTPRFSPKQMRQFPLVSVCLCSAFSSQGSAGGRA